MSNPNQASNPYAAPTPADAPVVATPNNPFAAPAVAPAEAAVPPIHPAFVSKEGVVMSVDEQRDLAAQWVADAKYSMQTGAGGDKSAKARLKNSLGILEQTTIAKAKEEGIDPKSTEFTDLETASMEMASQKQAEHAATQEAKSAKPPLLARAGNFLQTKVFQKTWFKRLAKWGVPATAAVAIVAVGVGIATGTILPLAVAAPAIVSKALIGAGAGGAGKALAHIGQGAVLARKERLAENTGEATKTRNATELAEQKAKKITDAQSVYKTAYEQAVTTRKANTEARKKKIRPGLVAAVVKGTVKGFVTGGLAGVGLSALGVQTPNFFGKWNALDTHTTGGMIEGKVVPTHTGGPVNPEGGAPTGSGSETPTLDATEASKAEQAMINEMMQSGAEHGKASLNEAAATFEGKGNNLWAKYQDAADVQKLTDKDALLGIVGDGAENGGLEQMNASQLFDVDMGGQAKMTPDGLKFSGDTWWVNKAVAKENLYVASADGKTTFFFDKGHQLTQNEQAAVLDLLSQKGTKILGSDTVREMIDKEFNPTPEQLGVELKSEADQVVVDFDKQWNQRLKLDPTIGAEALQSAQREQMQAIIDANAKTLNTFPESYLKYLTQQLDVRSQIPPAAIQDMLEKSLGKDLQLVE